MIISYSSSATWDCQKSTWECTSDTETRAPPFTHTRHMGKYYLHKNLLFTDTETHARSCTHTRQRSSHRCAAMMTPARYLRKTKKAKISRNGAPTPVST